MSRSVDWRAGPFIRRSVSVNKKKNLLSQELNLSFLSPAFLGDAEQKGQLRTPPLKALLREWWRVVVAPDVQYDVSKMRGKEGGLFGSVAGTEKEQSSQSQVRLRLEEWRPGKLSSLADRAPTEGDRSTSPSFLPALYLGYGPVINKRQRAVLKNSPAISDRDPDIKLRISYPSDCQKEMNEAIRLMQAFGTLGGRSHNGWGSLDLSSSDSPGFLWPLHFPREFEKITRDLNACLKCDWPTAIARDDRGGPLVWRLKVVQEGSKEGDKKKILTALAHLRQGLNKEGKNKPVSGVVTGRQILSLPVTASRMSAGDGGSARLPSSLRFKVVWLEGEKGEKPKIGAIVYHMPFDVRRVSGLQGVTVDQQIRFWTDIHSWLDKQCDRIKGGPIG